MSATIEHILYIFGLFLLPQYAPLNCVLTADGPVYPAFQEFV